MRSYILLSIIFFTFLFLILFSSNKEKFETNNLIKNNIYTEYIHKKCYSIPSKIINFVIGVRSYFNHEKKIKSGLLEDSISEFEIPKWIRINYNFETYLLNKRQVVTITPKNNKNKDKIIIYLHGGAYVNNITSYHWEFINTISKNTGYTIIIPDYPLAPKFKTVDVIDFITTIYVNAVKAFPNSKIIIMGDSAGGGLSLAFAKTIKDNPKTTQPSQLILLSPWLDLTHTNPEIKAVEKNDKMLSTKLLNIMAKNYAGNLSLVDPRVSPIYGDFKNLPPTSIFIGTHDILFPDSKKLKNLLVSNQISTSYFEYPKSYHVWMVVGFTSEAKDAINRITTLLLN